MSFNTLDYLKAGNVDFVYRCTPYDKRNLIKYVRESNNRNEIINGFLDLLKDKQIYFCFDIIYDMDDYYDTALEMFHKYYRVKDISKEKIQTLLNNSKLSVTIVKENLDELLQMYSDDIEFILDYLFANKDIFASELRNLSIHANLHIRYQFMKYLIINHYDMINDYYDDITRYFTSETYQEYEQLSFLYDKMDQSDLCKLACVFLDKDNCSDNFKKLKDYILANYDQNDLASELLGGRLVKVNEHMSTYEKSKQGIIEFIADADRLFSTASIGKLQILNNYSQHVSEELIRNYQKQLSYFDINGKTSYVYGTIDVLRLGAKLNEYVDKYLSLSKDTTHSFIGSGSTSDCFRIGDYVFKLVRTKWSYEDVICPNLYLILDNLEEILIRGKDGIIKGGIEVQKYLKRSAEDVSTLTLCQFGNELRKLGYYSTDTFMRGTCGDNCRVLDSYEDSGNPNPPDWFKEYPIVLVDRDRIYKNDNTSIKQLRNGY